MQVETIRAAQRQQDSVDGAASAALFLGSVATSKAPMPPVASTSATTAAGWMVGGFLPDHLQAARETVIANQGALQERYAGAAFDAAVAYDVERGAAPADAATKRSGLAPTASEVNEAFGTTYGLMADLERKLGENP
jgi:hypothetical protein